jgi:hypothetical protein
MDDTARISVSVAVPPHVAFEIFTNDIDRWWRRGSKFRHSGRRSGFIRLEPHVGGRLFESIDGDAGPLMVLPLMLTAAIATAVSRLISRPLYQSLADRYPLPPRTS